LLLLLVVVLLVLLLGEVDPAQEECVDEAINELEVITDSCNELVSVTIGELMAMEDPARTAAF